MADKTARCKNCGDQIYEYPQSVSGWTHPDSGSGNAWCQPVSSRSSRQFAAPVPSGGVQATEEGAK